MEGPISFLVPELTEKTLMNKEHNDLQEKMEFVLDLSRCIVDLARTRGSPLAESVFYSDSSTNKNSPRPSSTNQILFNSESQRCLEQLLLYVRVLQLLGATLQLARATIAAGSLQPTSSVKQILREINTLYQQCLTSCKTLSKSGSLFDDCIEKLSTDNITIDKLIYSCAIEMCQTAAMDEGLGNTHECYRHYHVAHLLFHSLSHQAEDPEDKNLLIRLREGVEKRLMSLHSRGFVLTKTASS